MNFQQNLLNDLQKLLSWKKSRAFYAEKLGVDIATIDELLVELRSNKAIPKEFEEEGKEYNFDNKTIKINTHYQSEPSADDIIRDHKIDTNENKLSGYWVKAKEGGWQVSAHFTQIEQKHKELSNFQTFLENYRTPHIPVVQKNQSTSDEGVCMLLSLPDAHIDKLTIDGRTIQQNVRTFYQVMWNLLEKTKKSSKIDEIVFVIGNDFFHTDSVNNTTTKGTPLQVNSEWDKAYEYGFDLLVQCINTLKKECATLKVVLMQGNHPYAKEFYVSHALEMYFRNDPNIIFDISTKHLKIHQYGENLLCFNHGNNVNDKLPLAFATTFYKEWGECKYREILIADKHHNVEKLYRSQGEAFGVRMRILPSLSGTDKWHNENLFINSIQSGIAIIYDRNKGRCMEIEERI